MKLRPTVFYPVLIAAVSAISMVVGMRLQESLTIDGYLNKVDKAPYHAIYQSIEHIQEKYYGDLEDAAFTKEVLLDIFEELDPYSTYLEQVQTKRYDRFVQGDYHGLGIDFARGEDLIVFDVVPGSPADIAQVPIGAKVISYQGVTLADADYDSVLLARTKLGDTISMELLYPDSEVSKQVSLVTANVDLPLVNGWVISDGGEYISLIKVERVYKGMFRHFMEILEEHQKYQPQGLILDLRDNPGGVVDETVKLLNQLIKDKDQLLLSTKTKSHITKEYKSTGRSFFPVGNIVVLINANSASASEILAGVLQDYDRALVLGQPSYGKGLIQQNFDLANGGSINLSIGEYILPSGRSIYRPEEDTLYQSLKAHRVLASKQGITPDVILVDCTDPALERKSKHLFQVEQIWWDLSFSTIEAVLPMPEQGDTCSWMMTRDMRWYLSRKLLRDSVITKRYLDGQLLEAVDMISSPLYEEILRGSH